ncbi:MAG: GntR family transcriptional regulator [Lactobacillales bacterium]|jgi:GntR family transcriptional regulator|nr:GntR family transcriptional regulator [Lactobacillales bacterium]
MEFDLERPIYQQIMDWIKMRIISGELILGQKVEAVREMALELQTNPNTVQRALGDLEREGILFSKRGLGRFVSEDKSKILELKNSKVKQVTLNFLQTMTGYGFSEKETADYLNQVIDEME